MIKLRSPNLDEAATLTALCLRSKATWGYDERFMRACREELTFTSTDMGSPFVQVAEADKQAIGFVEVVPRGKSADLAKLFVEPTSLRSGIGRLLFEWAKDCARAAGALELTIEAAPDAAGFYRRMGTKDNGFAPSGSIPGRLLPRLVVRLQ
jgi:GNAT superfamily N-acetyltransferase